MNHRHIHHRLAHTGIPFVVLAQTAIQHEPTERPLHDPTLGQRHETRRRLHATYNLQGPAVNDPHALGRSLASITAVRPNLPQPREARLGLVQDRFPTILVLDVDRVHHAGDEHTQHIDQQMPLTAADFLAGVVAALRSALGGFDRLAVEEGRAWRGLLASLATDLGMEGMMNAQPQSVDSPAVEVGGDGAPRRKVVGQLPPRAAGAFQIEDGVEDRAVIQAASSAAFVGFG